MAHFSFKRTPGITSNQERSSQQSGADTGSSPLSSYSRNWPSRGISGEGDRTITQPSSRFSLNTSGSPSFLPRHLDTSRLSSTLPNRRSLSPTRAGDGLKLPRILEDPNPNASTRRFAVKEEMSSPDIVAPSRPSLGGPGHGEGGPGFRFSATAPSVSRLSHSASSNTDVHRGSRDLQRSPSRHSSREATTGPEFDLHMIASKWTGDLKDAQAEIEELKHELGVLQVQLEASKVEKSDLLRRLKRVKDAAKESQEKSGAILEDLGNSIKSLREGADSWSGLAREVQSMVPDIKHLKVKANDTIASLTPHIHGDQLNKNARELMNELKIDCKNSQEVTTILRDRLTTLSSDLIEARSRISDLEIILAQDRQAIGSLSAQLVIANQETVDLSRDAKTMGKELRDAATNAAELEVELANAQERIEEVEKELAESEAISAEVPGLQETIYELKRQLSSAEERAAEVIELRDEALVTQQKLSDLKEENQNLQSSLEQNTSALDNRTSSLAKSEQKISEILEELSASQNREKAVSEASKIDKATFEVATKRLESHVSSLEAEVECSRESATRANTSLQALQDRFDEQSVTLRLTKETNAELRERVVDIEKTALKEQGIMEGRVSVLELNCSALQISNRDLTESLEREKSSARSVETTHQQQLSAGEKKLLALEAAAKEAQIFLEESKKKMNDQIVENGRLQQELAAAKAIPPSPPSPPKATVEDSDILVALRADIARLQDENGELTRKFNTIEERYKNGDLTDQEKSLVRTIRGEARIAQEQQLDMKTNELIRRERTIQARDMKIKQLEEMITRLHKQVAKIGDQPSNADKRPASDPNIPSQVSSPPVHDRGGPSLQGTPVANKTSVVRLADKSLRTPTRTLHPQEPERTPSPRKTIMKSKGKGLGRSTVDATGEIVDSDEEFDEPVVSALGKRDRFGGLNKRTDARKDSSGEEAERPHKNRKTKAAGQNNVSTKASDATVVARRRRNRN